MPGAPGVLKTIAGSGATTFAAGGRAEWNLSQLVTIAGSGPRRPYLKALVIEADITWKNSNAAARTLQWQRSFEAFARGVLQVPGHVFIDCFSSFGRVMRDFHRLMTGRNPEGGGSNPTGQALSGGQITDLVIPGANGTLVQNMKILIPMFDLRGVNGEDYLHHCGVFKGGSFQLDWAANSGTAGGIFGADVFINAGTVKVSALIKKRDDVRFAPWWTIQERQMANLTDFISPEGVVYTDLWLEAVPAANGLTFATITQANVTALTLIMQQGERVLDGVPPQTVIAAHNAEQPTSSESYVAQPESGNCELIPLFQLGKASGKVTHIVPEVAKPQLQIVGTLPVAQAILGMRYIRPSGPKTVEDQAQRADEPLPDRSQFPRAVIAAKTDSKQLVSQSKSKWLPQKVYRLGLPGQGSAA